MSTATDPTRQPAPIYISVILPVRNEARFIGATLDQLCTQDYPIECMELIVVDGESTDATVAEVRAAISRHPRTRISLASNPKRLSSAARNIGASIAAGDYVLIVDGHVEIPSRTLLHDAAEIVRRTGAEVLGRPQRLSPGELSATQRVIASVRACAIGHALDSFIYSDAEGFVAPGSVAVMYSKALIARFGGFDESFDAAEDLEFNMRLEHAGLLCYTSPKLEVFYYPRESLSALFRQMTRYGIGRARLWRKMRQWPSPAAAAPPMAVLLAALLTLLAFISNSAATALAVLSCLYVCIVLFVRSRDAALIEYPAWRVLATLLVVHGGLGFGVWRGALRR